MFCTKCGNQLDNDALFCTSCGNKVKKEKSEESGQTSGDTINISISSEKAKGFFKNIFDVLRNPISYVQILKDTLSIKNNIILLVVSLLLIPIVNIISLKSILSNTLFSLGQLGSILEGRSVNHMEAVSFKQSFNLMFDTVAPTGKIFMFNIVFTLLLLSIVSGIVFIGIKTSGNTLNFEGLVRILTLPIIILLLSAIISPLFLSVSLMLFLIVSLAFSGMFIITLYTGFKSVAPSFKLLPYVYPVAFALGISITYYISFQMLVSDLMSTFMKFM